MSKKVPGDLGTFFYMQLPHLPIHNYGNGSISWTASVATQLTSSSHKLLSIAF